MKSIKFGVIFTLVVLAIYSCRTPKDSINNEPVPTTNQTTDSLEQARLNRVDSASQINNGSNTPSGSFTNPPKVVKKKVKKD